jgi:hypothetical protein
MKGKGIVREPKEKGSITAEEFDRRFEAGEDMSEYLDYSKARRPGREPQRVNVDFPGWMVDALDKEAARIGVTRQDLIKLWVAEKLR